MAKKTTDRHLFELARRGARTQLRDLVQEMRYLLEWFPDLRDSFDADELPLSFIIAQDSARAAKGQVGRKPMSAAERRAVSKRMKKLWAARRKAGKA